MITTQSIIDLKKIIDENKEFFIKQLPEKNSGSYLFVSPELKDLYYFLFDLEELELECAIKNCNLNFFILVQKNNNKIFNTTYADNYEKIYFYPWLTENLKKLKIDENIALKAFIDFKKMNLKN